MHSTNNFVDSLFLLQELQQCMNRGETAGSRNSKVREPVVLRYPLPYPQDPPPLPLVPQQPAELQYGNPYSEQETRGGCALQSAIFYSFILQTHFLKSLDIL